MAITVITTDGVEYTLPETGDRDWSDVTPAIAHLSKAVLQGAAIETPQIVLTPASITLANGATLTPGNRSVYLVGGSTANVTLSNSLPIAAGSKDGALLYLVGRDSTAVTIPDNQTNINLNGPCTLRQDEMIQLYWIQSASRWVELARNN